MGELTIRIDLSNAAFQDEDGGPDDRIAGLEVARILRSLADRAESFGVSYLDDLAPKDVNGNTVGSIE